MRTVGDTDRDLLPASGTPRGILCLPRIVGLPEWVPKRQCVFSTYTYSHQRLGETSCRGTEMVASVKYYYVSMRTQVQSLDSRKWPGAVVYACNSSTEEDETNSSLGFAGQPA